MNSLKNKVAIVSGGSRGIGKAIVSMLCQSGCQVAFGFRSHQESALLLEKQMKNLGGNCKATQVDVTDFQQVKKWIEDTKENFGHLDILINNVGVIREKTLMMMSQEEWQEVVNTNLNGVFNVTQACIATFLKQKQGNIINISSISGITGLPGQTNYSASEGGINAFTKALAKEVAPYGIRVNAVAPGFIETETIAKFNPEQKEEIIKNIPLGRMGTVKDVAHCVKFLLSDYAQYITGQIIQVDGGLVMRS